MRVICLDREAARREIVEAVSEMARQRPEIRRVVLFGSLATGRAAPGSDADLLIILERSDQSFPDRIPRYLPDGCRISVDVFPYTQSEVEQMLAAGHRFVKRALEEGVEIFPIPV